MIVVTRAKEACPSADHCFRNRQTISTIDVQPSVVIRKVLSYDIRYVNTQLNEHTENRSTFHP